MKIYTSYFAKCQQLREAGLMLISTATRIPKWEEGKGIFEFKQLAPTPDMLSLFKYQYEPKYLAILAKIDAGRLLKYLTDVSKGKDIVLLCYEAADKCAKGETYCHRHMLAKWFTEKTGIAVEEYQFPNEKKEAKKRAQNNQQSLF